MLKITHLILTCKSLILLKKQHNTQSSLNFLQTGLRKFTTSDFSGIRTDPGSSECEGCSQKGNPQTKVLDWGIMFSHVGRCQGTPATKTPATSKTSATSNLWGVGGGCPRGAIPSARHRGAQCGASTKRAPSGALPRLVAFQTQTQSHSVLATQLPNSQPCPPSGSSKSQF